MQTLGGRQFWGDVQFCRGWRIQRNVFTGHYRLLDDRDVRQVSGTEAACQQKLTETFGRTAPTWPRRSVLLIHGILRSSKSMAFIGRRLQSDGWAPVPFDYPSSQISIPEAADYLQSVLARLTDADELSFVCHSMGGLVLRAWFAAHADARVRRAVLIGTPNRGAELADMLRKNLLFRAVFGPSGQQLGTHADGVIPTLPPPRCEFAVIAGARGTPDGWNPLISGDDDGTVSVDSTRLSEAADFGTVRALHSNLLRNAEVADMCANFLQSGRLRTSPGSET